MHFGFMDQLQLLAKIEGVALVVVDDDLPGSPGCFVYVLDQRHAFGCKLSGKRCYVVGLQVEVYMPAFVNVRNRWVLLVDELKVNALAPGSYPDIEVLI